MGRPIILFTTLIFIAGILSSSCIRSSPGRTVTALLLLLLFLLTALERSDRIRSGTWLNAAFLFIACLYVFLFGLQIAGGKGERNHRVEWDTVPAELLVKIWKCRSGPRYLSAQSVVVASSLDPSFSSGNWKVLVYIKNEIADPEIKTGALIRLHGVLKSIVGKMDDGRDWAEFYAKQGIFANLFVKNARDIIVVQGTDEGRGFLLRCQKVLARRFETIGISRTSVSLLKAMLLGDRTDLGGDLKSLFSKTGIMHLLAVSGLHVGIVYFILSGIFNFLTRFSRRNAISFFPLTAALWSYAGLTAFSPSVVRASLMLNLYLIGKEIKRKAGILNILALSVFLTLAYDHELLYNVGFQFSYAAVLGIVMVFPILYVNLRSGRKWLRYIWSLTAVSISAQLSTFPLAMHYFGTFPSYFLLSNLIAIPLSAVLVGGGALLLLCSYVPVISGLISSALDILITEFLHVIRLISDLPYAQVRTSLDLFHTCLVYVLIIAVIQVLHRPVKGRLLLFQIIVFGVMVAWQLT